MGVTVGVVDSSEEEEFSEEEEEEVGVVVAVMENYVIYSLVNY